MIVGQMLLPVALLLMIMYYMVGFNSMPDFWPFALSVLVLNIAGTVIRHYLGVYAIVPNIAILIGGIALIHKLEVKQVAKSVGIYALIMIIFRIIKAMILS